MTKRNVAFWVFTGLSALVFLAGGVMDLVQPRQLVEDMTRLGYPAYFMLILGAWKVLGALALIAPGLPRLKEWAYAGMVFDLTGATFSHAAVGDDAGKIVTPLLLAGLVLGSWALRPADRVLGSDRSQRSSGALQGSHAPTFVA